MQQYISVYTTQDLISQYQRRTPPDHCSWCDDRASP